MLRLPTLAQLRSRLAGAGGAVLGTAATSLLVRGISILASLMTVPVVLHHLGQQRYGVWMAAIALSTFFTMADGGVTKGLIAEVSKAYGARNRAGIRALIGSALATTSAIVLVFAVGLLVLVPLIDWTWVFHLPNVALGDEALGTVLTISLSYLFSFIPTVIRETRVGMLQGASVNLWDAAGLVLGFLGVVAAARADFGLVAIAGIWAGAPALMRTVSAITFFGGQGRDLVPRWRDVDPATCRLLVAAGGAFMLYALTSVLAVQSDQVLIARFLGPEAVTQYTVVQRLFNQIQVLVTLGLIAQWPAYGAALGRGDHAWIRRHFRWSLLGYGAFAALVSGALYLFCAPILGLWVGDAVVAPVSLVRALTVYAMVATIANAFAFFYMSLGLNRRLVVAQGLLIALTLPLYLLLIPRLGGTGAVIAATIGQVVGVVVPGLLTMKSLFSGLGPRRQEAKREVVGSAGYVEREAQTSQFSKGSVA